MKDPQSARRALVAARQRRDEAEPRWRQAILDALAAGVGVVEVARLAGCTRQRVYQIRDEGRTSRLDSGQG